MKSECYCAALRLAARKTTAIYDDALAPSGINVAQFSLLRKIDAYGPISLTALGRLSGLERSTVGRNCRVLEGAGLIAPADGEDAREACIALTPVGRRAIKRALAQWQDAQRKIETSLGEDGVAHLRSLLQRL